MQHTSPAADTAMIVLVSIFFNTQAGVAAADAGAAGLVLHARTADQQYSPPAHWEAVQQLVQAVPGLPVIGNGDVFEAADAVQLMRQTGCHGEGMHKQLQT